jgi:hypothetical protein
VKATPVWIAVAGLWLATAAAAMVSFACAPLAHAGARADFNGDGRSDLAIGAPHETLGNGTEKVGAGAVHVLYGARHGLGLAGDRYLTEDTPGLKSVARTDDGFGSSFATGDFDGDGYADLVIGAWLSERGAVHILYGTRRGLTLKGDQYLTENSPGIKGGRAEFGDHFGFGLAAGDFSRDGRDDLAIGALNAHVFSEDSSDGAVHVLYGGRRHLRVRRDQYLTTKNLGFTHFGTDVGFGGALAAGDLNGDGRTDLAVGSPFEQVGRDSFAGTVRILFGGAHRLSRRGIRLFTENSKRMAGPGAECCVGFGASLAIGRFNSGRRRDLAIGVPEAEPSGSYGDHLGAVHVLYGGRRGPSLRGDQYLSTLTPGVPGGGWYFGDSLATGDLNGDGRQELAVGSPYQTVPGTGYGAVHVFYGASRHLRPPSDQFLTEGRPGIAGDGPHQDDLFGFALGAGDFDGDGRGDLAVGEPQPCYYDICDECDSALGGGGVHVLYGARMRLSLKGDQFLTQDTPGIVGDATERCDEFGKAVSGGAR